MDTVTKARHALQRLTYGPRPGELESLQGGGETGIRAWLDAQLAPETIADPEVEARLAPLATLKLTSSQISTRYKHPDQLMRDDGIEGREDDPAIVKRLYNRHIQRVLDELRLQRLVRVIHAKAQLNELLVEFWFNHLNVAWAKIPVRWLITSYERDVIRPRIFGKFRDLVSASAHHPAMLEFLDNSLSRVSADRKATNENYARELMELHTMGSNGGYSQADVIALARILTGWTQDTDLKRCDFAFRPGWHDEGPKTLLGVSFPGSGGVEEGQRAIDLLCKHKSTAAFISRKLARFFVSDSPPEALVSQIANRFHETDGDLREVYRALFASEEFWSASARSAKTKRPLQFLASAVRKLGGSVQGGIEESNTTHLMLANLGEPLYQCDSPTGYHDDPRYWVSAGAMVLRMKAAQFVSENRLPGLSVPGSDPQEMHARTLALASPEFQKR